MSTITMQQQHRLSSILSSFSKEEALWAVKYLVWKLEKTATSNVAGDSYARKAKVKRREGDISDEELKSIVSSFPDLKDIPDTDVSEIIRANSGKGLDSFRNWL